MQISDSQISNLIFFGYLQNKLLNNRIYHSVSLCFTPNRPKLGRLVLIIILE